MEAAVLHPWNVSPSQAIEIQRRLAPEVVKVGDPDVRLVAGADIAAGRRYAMGRGAVIVLRYPELTLEERVVIDAQVEFPYVPGLLTFREAPILLAAFRQLRLRPDLLLVDGQGLAHPRRLGIASHLGLLLDLPTIGCAKSRLCGEHGILSPEAGSRVPLSDGDERIGLVLRTRHGVAPLFVSIGHKIGLDQAAEWVLRCCCGFRIPEPLRVAHMSAGRSQTEIEVTR